MLEWRPRRGGLAVVLGVVFSLLMPAPASAGPRPTVVELFTAQGCPLCPPAEKYFGELVKRDDVLPLAFHIDYWDHLGWPDPFARPAYSRRQQHYSDRLGLPYVYTPQIVVDGRFETSGSRPDDVDADIAKAAAAPGDSVEVTLIRLSPTQLRIALPVTALADGPAEVVLVGFDERHETVVSHGKNSGMTLVNFHVVREVRAIATWRGGAFDLTVPLDGGDLSGGTDYCAVLVQQPGQGRIIGAGVIDMRGAAGNG